jgi:hypothetical protein
MFEIIATAFAVYVLLAIAFPDRLLPQYKPKKKMLGSSYWGVYEGTPTEDLDSEGKIEAPKPARQQKMTAGSTMYAMGRGVSMKR